MTELKVVPNATCTFCGCVCDDIELHADGERITHTKAACVLGASWFKNHTAERLYPDALIDGQPATVDEAVEAAAEFLYKADLPLVYGLSNVTCEAQRESVALAELTGGVLGTAEPPCGSWLGIVRGTVPNPCRHSTPRSGMVFWLRTGLAFASDARGTSKWRPPRPPRDVFDAPCA